MPLLQTMSSIRLSPRFAKCKWTPKRAASWKSRTDASRSFIPVYVGASVALVCGVFMKVTVNFTMAWDNQADLYISRTKSCMALQRLCKAVTQDLAVFAAHLHHRIIGRQQYKRASCGHRSEDLGLPNHRNQYLSDILDDSLIPTIHRKTQWRHSHRVLGRDERSSGDEHTHHIDKPMKRSNM